MPFLGMRGTGDWISNQRPESWDEKYFRLFPNGQTPLTAIMAMMKSRPVNDPTFHWFRKGLPTFKVTGTAGAFIYTESGLSTEYSTTYPLGGAYAVAAATLYIKMALADLATFKLGHTILLRSSSNYTLDVAAVVTTRTEAGASSYVTIKLLEADNNGLPAATVNLSSCDTVIVIGSAYGEGTARAVAITQDGVEDYNYCQIFKDSLDLTNTARVTYLRTGDAYQESKRDCLEAYNISRERAYLWGRRYLDTDPVSGKPRRFTGGIVNKIATNRYDYTSDTDYAGQDWVQGGEDWLMKKLEVLFRYGPNERLALCGSGAILGIDRLVKAGAIIQVQPGTVDYGLKIGTWLTPFGTLYMKTHPLFSYEPTDRYSMVVVVPSNLERRTLRETKFETDIQDAGMDSKIDQFIGEDGLEMQFEETFGYFNGIGQDNGL